MSEIGISEGASAEAEKPVQPIEDVKFPPFPEPTSIDFEENLSEEERAFYKNKFSDLNDIVHVKLHCTACDRHLGCSARNESRMRPHPMLRTLICHTCHSFYNSGEFDKGEDGSELYCRWCGQGGQVYCCSDCIHVFCAKCIKRNMGIAKIREIENTDDWKCFKCNPNCLWELRAVCWALLRYCEFRNKVVFETQDGDLKEKYLKAIAIDTSECCKHKGRRREKPETAKKKEKEKEVDSKKIVPKLPPTIQVKKFASINLNDTPKIEKKSLKRPPSPKHKLGYIQNPISIAPCTTLSTPPILKKIRLPAPPLLNQVRFTNEKKITNTMTYTRVPRPRQPFPIPIVNSPFNGINHPYINMPSIMGDNINLSLETLTQGLDMSAVAAFNNPSPDNDNVVCTPDFPLEPLCEVMEDNDDDVECITPGPVVPPKINNPPPLVPRSLPDISSDNIVQMTDNDVTVNSLTGGLKFRVDPQTLSSKKMYRLPDGRIFAINPNPNMPGGYSATIVSVSEGTNKVTPKGGETYAAKLSAITSTPTASASSSKTPRTSNIRKPKVKSTPRPKGQKTKETTREPKESRECDLKVPVEWYRYNLIDAVDALDYSLSRLNKLKKEATTTHLRTRTVEEIKYLHRTLEQLLSTSSKRFLEIRENLNKELKQYIARKSNSSSSAADMTEDDDDVEFLPNAGNDDPIFIDENSGDSFNGNENQEVDLTGVVSSEHNDSAENKNDFVPLICSDSLPQNNNTTVNFNESGAHSPHILSSLLADDKDITNEKQDAELSDKKDTELHAKLDPAMEEKQDTELLEKIDDKLLDKQVTQFPDKQDIELSEKQCNNTTEKQDTKLNYEHDSENEEMGNDEDEMIKNDEKKDSDTEDDSSTSNTPISDQKNGKINGDNDDEGMEVDSNEQSISKVNAGANEEQTQYTEMSEDMINSLLKDDTLDGVNNDSNTNSLDVPEELQHKQ